MAAISAAGILIGSGWKYGRSGWSAEQLKPAACTGCHTVITEMLPNGHAGVTAPPPASCKKCHAVGGQSKPFEWLGHFKHYAGTSDAPECEGCHLLVKAEDISENESLPNMLSAEIAGRWRPFFNSWGTRGYMDNAHAQKGVTCRSCHGGVSTFEVPELEKCLSCHKQDDGILEKNNGGQPDPHQSHLESPPCTLCHKAHEKSINYCNSDGCHQYDFKFPYPNKK